jgi:hypothetical protein
MARAEAAKRSEGGAAFGVVQGPARRSESMGRGIPCRTSLVIGRGLAGPGRVAPVLDVPGRSCPGALTIRTIDPYGINRT